VPYNREVAEQRGPSPFTAALRANGYTLRRFSEFAKVTYNHVVNVSRGRSRASAELAEAFEKATGQGIEEFLEAGQASGYVRKSTDAPGARWSEDRKRRQSGKRGK